MTRIKRLEQLYHDINEEWEFLHFNPDYEGNLPAMRSVFKYFQNGSKRNKCAVNISICNRDATKFNILGIKCLHSLAYEEDRLEKSRVSYYTLSILELAMRILQKKGMADFGITF